MDSETKTDSNHLAHTAHGLDYTRWFSHATTQSTPFNSSWTKDQSSQPIPSTDEQETCISCQLCGQMIKSTKILIHMAMHFLQFSKSSNSDDPSVTWSPSTTTTTTRFVPSSSPTTGFLMEYGVQPNHHLNLIDTMDRVLRQRLDSVPDAEAFVVLAIELVANMSLPCSSLAYHRLNKICFHLDALHDRQATSGLQCSHCNPPMRFVLESSRALHMQLTHPSLTTENTNTLSNRQIVTILDDVVTMHPYAIHLKDDSMGKAADNFVHTATTTQASVPWNFAVDLPDPIAKRLSNGRISTTNSGILPLHLLPSAEMPNQPLPLFNLPTGDLPLPLIDAKLTGLVHPSMNLQADCISSMLAAATNFPTRLWDNLISFKSDTWPCPANTSQKKPKGIDNLSTKLIPTSLVNSPTLSGFSLTPGQTQTQQIATQQAMANAQQQRRSRTRLSESQLAILRSYFDINNSPSEEKIVEICMKTGLPGKVVKHWFRNTLFKERQRTKDNPYNFSVPPSTSIDLEEYEKTGRIEVRPAPADTIASTPNDSVPSMDRATESHPGQSMSDSESQVVREPSAVSASTNPGLASDGVPGLNRMEQYSSSKIPGSAFGHRKRSHENQSQLACSPVEPSPIKRSRSSSACSFGVEYESPRRLSRISSPGSISNTGMAPLDVQLLDTFSHRTTNSGNAQMNAFNLANWFQAHDSIRSLTSESAGPVAFGQDETTSPTGQSGRQSSNPSSGLFHIGFSGNATTGTVNPLGCDDQHSPLNCHASAITTNTGTSTPNSPIDAFQLQKQVEAFMMAAALSQKVTSPPVSTVLALSSDPSSDAPLDLSASSPYLNKTNHPSVPLFHVDLPLNTFDPSLTGFPLSSTSENGIKSYPSMIHHSLPCTIGITTTHSSHASSTASVAGSRRNRTSITVLQSRCMQAIYAHHKTPSVHECDRLGAMIGLTRRVVQVWFQNQRAKEKKMARVASSYSPGTVAGSSTYPQAPLPNHIGLVDNTINPAYCGLCDTPIHCELTPVQSFHRSVSSSVGTDVSGAATTTESLGMSGQSPTGPTCSANALATHASFVDHLFSASHLKKLIGLCSIEVQSGQT